MKYRFTKMQGTGNDFVIFDGFSTPLQLSKVQIRQIADRHFGIGCDQVLLLEPCQDADALYRIYNADGNEVSQCGNGARCAAIYLYQQKLVGHKTIRVRTGERHMSLKIDSDGEVAINMGAPRFEPQAIPLLSTDGQAFFSLTVNKVHYSIMSLSLGNPHAVLKMERLEEGTMTDIVTAIQQSGHFPEGVNIGFMQLIDRKTIHLRVYERGVGETLSCGSGACAAVIVGCLKNGLEDEVKVQMPGGTLTVVWQEGKAVWLKGPAVRVFEGEIEL